MIGLQKKDIFGLVKMTSAIYRNRNSRTDLSRINSRALFRNHIFDFL
jgi:hypothetical protein